MSERKLAHIEIISKIEGIPGADMIEVCTVLGWHCVIAKKDNFQIGDRVVYIEVDSIVPDIPQFAFLRDRKFRVKTIKLRKQISQGLVIPIEGIFCNSSKHFNIGDDVTDLLGIKKYLSASELEENTTGTGEKFPYWVSKTDEERIQNIPHVLKQFADEEVYVTEKIDYQSGTWTSKKLPIFKNRLLRWIKKIRFVVASRNRANLNKNSLYWQIAEKYRLEELCKQYPGLTIQGEQGNTNVQGNKYKLTGPKMWVFNIINPNGCHLCYHDMKILCDVRKLDTVPLIKKCKLSELGSTVDELVEFSKGKSMINSQIQREGIVVRCVKNGSKLLSFKVINPNFLLKYD